MLSVELFNIVVLARFKYENLIGLSFVMRASNILDEANGLADIFISGYCGDGDKNAQDNDDDLSNFLCLLAEDELINSKEFEAKQGESGKNELPGLKEIELFKRKDKRRGSDKLNCGQNNWDNQSFGGLKLLSFLSFANSFSSLSLLFRNIIRHNANIVA